MSEDLLMASGRQDAPARTAGPVDEVTLVAEIPAASESASPVAGPVAGPIDGPISLSSPSEPPPSLPAKTYGLSGSQTLLSFVMLTSLATLLVVVMARATVEYHARLSAIHPALADLGLTAFGLLMIGLAVMSLRSLRRYRQIQRITTLQQTSAQMADSDGGHEVPGAKTRSDRLGRQQIQIYLDGLSRAAAADIDQEIQNLRIQYARYEGDLKRDFALLEETLLRRLDQKADRFAEHIAREVALGTALAPRFLDAPVVIWRSLALVQGIARIYAGRPGLFGTIRLFRNSLAVALISGVAESLTTALIESGTAALTQAVARRASEGMLNGVLMLRLSEAVKAQCRPVRSRTRSSVEIVRLAKSFVFAGSH